MSEIELVARALCKARDINPDAPYQVPWRYMDVVGGAPEHIAKLSGKPKWMALEQDAREFIAMFDGLFDSRAETPRIR